MLIAQISDTHLAGWGRRTFGVAPMGENLARCIRHINRLDPQPDLVLVTGDLTNNARPEEAERAASLLDALRAPFYVIPGNHDDRAVLRAAFAAEHCPAEDETFIHYTIEGYPLRLIAVDTTIPDAPGGEVCEKRAAWLEAALEEAPRSPAVLFMHHPPLRMGLVETDLDGFLGASRLERIVRAHPNVIRILAGHIHLASLARWGGTVVSTAPSIGMRLYVDLTLKRSAYILDAPAYQLHYWTPQEHLVTHTVRVQEPEILRPFSAA